MIPEIERKAESWLVAVAGPVIVAVFGPLAIYLVILTGPDDPGTLLETYRELGPICFVVGLVGAVYELWKRARGQRRGR